MTSEIFCDARVMSYEFLGTPVKFEILSMPG